MAQESTLPSSPALLAPRHGTIVDGRSVTFSWEPAEGATTYRIEVARDTAFEDLLLEQELGPATRVTLKGLAPLDGQTYYWRVLTGDGTGWSEGEHVESFISGTPDVMQERDARPEDDEALGPVGALFRASSVQAAAEISSDDPDAVVAAEAGVEREGVATGQILGIAFAVLSAVVVIIIVLFMWTGVEAQAVRQAVVGSSGYPELRETEAAAARQLDHYDVVDDAQGIYRIPIDRAIDLMVLEAQQAPGRSYSAEIPALQPAPPAPAGDSL